MVLSAQSWKGGRKGEHYRQSLHSTIIRVRRDFLSASCRASLLAEGYPAERHLIPHRTPFPPRMHRPQIYKLGKWIGIQSPIFWIAKCLDGEVWPVTKWRSAGYPSVNYMEQRVRAHAIIWSHAAADTKLEIRNSARSYHLVGINVQWRDGDGGILQNDWGYTCMVRGKWRRGFEFVGCTMQSTSSFTTSFAKYCLYPANFLAGSAAEILPGYEATSTNLEYVYRNDNDDKFLAQQS